MRRTTVKFYCDRCGEEIAGFYWKLSPKSFTQDGKEQLNTHLINHVERDYCERCLMEILAVACAPRRISTEGGQPTPKGQDPEKEAPAAEPKEDEPKEEKKEAEKKPRSIAKRGKKNKKRPLDDGKIFALRNAGWNWEQIRDDLGADCSIETLRNHYKAEQERRISIAESEAREAVWMDMDDIDDENVLDGMLEG